MKLLGNTFVLLFLLTFSQKYFYWRFAKDLVCKIQKGQLDAYFGKVNNNHLNIKYSIKVNPEKFLDAKIVITKGIIKAEVNRNK